jgi:hypothetical protein
MNTSCSSNDGPKKLRMSSSKATNGRPLGSGIQQVHDTWRFWVGAATLERWGRFARGPPAYASAQGRIAQLQHNPINPPEPQDTAVGDAAAGGSSRRSRRRRVPLGTLPPWRSHCLGLLGRATVLHRWKTEVRPPGRYLASFARPGREGVGDFAALMKSRDEQRQMEPWLPHWAGPDKTKRPKDARGCCGYAMRGSSEVGRFCLARWVANAVPKAGDGAVSQSFTKHLHLWQLCRTIQCLCAEPRTVVSCRAGVAVHACNASLRCRCWRYRLQ